MPGNGLPTASTRLSHAQLIALQKGKQRYVLFPEQYKMMGLQEGRLQESAPTQFGACIQWLDDSTELVEVWARRSLVQVTSLSQFNSEGD